MELAATGWSCNGALTARRGEEQRSGRDPDTADSGKANDMSPHNALTGRSKVACNTLGRRNASHQEIAVEMRKHRRVGAAEGAAGPRLLSTVPNRRKSSGPFQRFGGGVKI
ncbi:hypothetical protein PR003_g8162 [Phytophthora rubi]|uniref:Uncharacterized protein n=1 Tax=Phytophthora rubi TaxID=129364 RepID=A0A6A3NCB3_9STRA|nr:hypothetical protein PR002_g6282 [Phytophthora rubi]KAE9042700.1 hypothetical protein PR001_g6082 [Phytophthora rubi]KAE9345014.1 hypothetical protein PR003_g8162 [Phytophthora rubi]